MCSFVKSKGERPMKRVLMVLSLVLAAGWLTGVGVAQEPEKQRAGAGRGEAAQRREAPGCVGRAAR